MIKRQKRNRDAKILLKEKHQLKLIHSASATQKCACHSIRQFKGFSTYSWRNFCQKLSRYLILTLSYQNNIFNCILVCWNRDSAWYPSKPQTSKSLFMYVHQYILKCLLRLWVKCLPDKKNGGSWQKSIICFFTDCNNLADKECGLQKHFKMSQSSCNVINQKLSAILDKKSCQKWSRWKFEEGYNLLLRNTLPFKFLSQIL